MVLLHSSVSSCFQLNAEYNRLTRPLCSGRITSLHCSYRSVRPSAPLRYSRLVAFTTCASPFTSERLVPAVPHESLDQLHASYTPVAACPVIRSPASSSQEIETLLILTTDLWFTTRHRRFTFVRLSDPYLFEVQPRHFDSNAHHRRLLTAAAWSGLQPAPESRLRRASLHLPCSLCTVRQFILNFLSVRLRRTLDLPPRSTTTHHSFD
jgi:hypothetical protein